MSDQDDFDALLDDCTEELQTPTPIVQPVEQPKPVLQEQTLPAQQPKPEQQPQEGVPLPGAFKDMGIDEGEFQDALKDILQDGGDSKEAMDGIKNMMNFLGKNMGEPQDEAKTTPESTGEATPEQKEQLSFLQKMMAQAPQEGKPQAPSANQVPASDPFGALNSMFKDFDKTATEQQSKAKEQQPEQANPSGPEFEKNFMGMFENLAKQLEGMEDEEGQGEPGDEDEAMKEAEKMIMGMFGNMADHSKANPGQADPMAGMPDMSQLFAGMGGGAPTGNQNSANKDQFADMFQSMGLNANAPTQPPVVQSPAPTQDEVNELDDVLGDLD